MSKLNIVSLSLSDLEVSEDNVRFHNNVECKDLALSIKEFGLLHPITVRKNGNKYSIIAGRRRFHAFTELSLNDDSFKAIPCIVATGNKKLDSLTSLTENINSVSMNAFERYKAIAYMRSIGNSIAIIAKKFGFKPLQVEKYIALGNISDTVKKAYYDDEIEEDLLHYLAKMSVEKQDAFLKFCDEENAWCEIETAKEYFFPKSVDAKHALFNVKKSGLSVLHDLFNEDDSEILDVDKFWTLQLKEVDKLQAELEKDGWSVKVISADTNFQEWNYNKTSKEDGGVYVLVINSDGQIDHHKGLNLGTSDNDESSTEESLNDGCVMPEKPTKSVRQEITAQAQVYYSDWHYQMVRNSLNNDNSKTFRLFVASLLSSNAMSIVQCNGFDPETTSKQLLEHDMTKAIDKRLDMFVKDFNLSFWGNGNMSSSNTKTFDFYKMLIDKSDEELIEICSSLQLIALQKDEKLIEQLGVEFEINPTDTWTCDTETVETFSSKDSTFNIAKEVVNLDDCHNFINLKLKDRREVVANSINDFQKNKDNKFVPKYMKFPIGYYGITKLDIAKL